MKYIGLFLFTMTFTGCILSTPQSVEMARTELEKKHMVDFRQGDPFLEAIDNGNFEVFSLYLKSYQGLPCKPAIIIGEKFKIPCYTDPKKQELRASIVKHIADSKADLQVKINMMKELIKYDIPNDLVVFMVNILGPIEKDQDSVYPASDCRENLLHIFLDKERSSRIFLSSVLPRPTKASKKPRAVSVVLAANALCTDTLTTALKYYPEDAGDALNYLHEALSNTAASDDLSKIPDWWTDKVAITKLHSTVDILKPYAKESCRKGDQDSCKAAKISDGIMSMVVDKGNSKAAQIASEKAKAEQLKADEDRKEEESNRRHAEAMAERERIAKERRSPLYAKCHLLSRYTYLRDMKKQFEENLAAAEEDTQIIGYVSLGNQAQMNDAKRGIHSAKKELATVQKKLKELSNISADINYCKTHFSPGEFWFSH